MMDQATLFVKKSWTVPAKHRQMRLDAFARACLPHLSRREIETAIRARFFSVGGRASKKGDRLAAGDELLFYGPPTWLAEGPLPRGEISLPVVYEDAAILVIDKPAGIATHGFSGRDTDTLANLLVARRPDLARVGKRWEPGMVHRLDRETSGLLLVAKTPSAFEHLRSQFRRRQVKKIYWALVWGKTPAQGVIDLPLAHDRRDKRRMRTAAGAEQRVWKAITRYRCIGQSRKLSLLEIDMETGVTHQIRAHLAAIGHPIVGDGLYSDRRVQEFGLERHFLHARSLTIVHPEEGRRLTVVAELPEELAESLRRTEIGF
jgi:23S rRNA pseudouridine1911/1915/1917 synthase